MKARRDPRVSHFPNHQNDRVDEEGPVTVEEDVVVKTVELITHKTVYVDEDVVVKTVELIEHTGRRTQETSITELLHTGDKLESTIDDRQSHSNYVNQGWIS